MKCRGIFRGMSEFKNRRKGKVIEEREFTCVVCGLKKMIPLSSPSKLTCSKKCLKEYRKTQTYKTKRKKKTQEITCIICGTVKTIPACVKGRLTCSKECLKIHMKSPEYRNKLVSTRGGLKEKEITCIICGAKKMIPASVPSRLTCSKECLKTYRNSPEYKILLKENKLKKSQK
jgi:hypothetical protein